LTHLLEDNGDEVVQLSILDHFPTFHAKDLLNRNSMEKWGSPEEIESKSAQVLIGAVIRLLRLDPAVHLRRIHLQLADDLAALARGEATSNSSVQEFYEEMRTYAQMLARFFMEFGYRSDNSFFKWLQQVKAPVTVYVASDGLRAVSTVHDDANDLGAKEVLPDCRVYFVQGRGHFDMMEDDGLVIDLQSY